MDVNEEPWSVIVDDNPPRLVITCKKPDERNEIIKGLRRTIIFRKAKKNPDDEAIIDIECKTEKRRDSMFKVMLLSMKATGKAFDTSAKLRKGLK